MDLPLGVKIPVQPGTKLLFARRKLGEKVRGVRKRQKGLLFPGVAAMPRRPCVGMPIPCVGMLGPGIHQAQKCGDRVVPGGGCNPLLSLLEDLGKPRHDCLGKRQEASLWV